MTRYARVSAVGPQKIARFAEDEKRKSYLVGPNGFGIRDDRSARCGNGIPSEP